MAVADPGENLFRYGPEPVMTTRVRRSLLEGITEVKLRHFLPLTPGETLDPWIG